MVERGRPHPSVVGPGAIGPPRRAAATSAPSGEQANVPSPQLSGTTTAAAEPAPQHPPPHPDAMTLQQQMQVLAATGRPDLLPFLVPRPPAVMSAAPLVGTPMAATAGPTIVAAPPPQQPPATTATSNASNTPSPSSAAPPPSASSSLPPAVSDAPLSIPPPGCPLPSMANVQLTEIPTPYIHPNDVLCGRGGGTNNHAGNEKFRELVNQKKVAYLHSSKRDKPFVSKGIVRAVRNQNPPGRFLQKDEKSGLWYDIGDQKAREKTSQALREGAPEIRREITTHATPPVWVGASSQAPPSQSSQASGSPNQTQTPNTAVPNTAPPPAGTANAPTASTRSAAPGPTLIPPGGYTSGRGRDPPGNAAAAAALRHHPGVMTPAALAAAGLHPHTGAPLYLPMAAAAAAAGMTAAGPAFVDPMGRIVEQESKSPSPPESNEKQSEIRHAPAAHPHQPQQQPPPHQPHQPLQQQQQPQQQQLPQQPQPQQQQPQPQAPQIAVPSFGPGVHPGQLGALRGHAAAAAAAGLFDPTRMNQAQLMGLGRGMEMNRRMGPFPGLGLTNPAALGRGRGVFAAPPPGLGNKNMTLVPPSPVMTLGRGRGVLPQQQQQQQPRHPQQQQKQLSSNAIPNHAPVHHNQNAASGKNARGKSSETRRNVRSGNSGSSSGGGGGSRRKDVNQAPPLSHDTTRRLVLAETVAQKTVNRTITEELKKDEERVSLYLDAGLLGIEHNEFARLMLEGYTEAEIVEHYYKKGPNAPLAKKNEEHDNKDDEEAPAMGKRKSHENPVNVVQAGLAKKPKLSTASLAGVATLNDKSIKDALVAIGAT